MLSAEGPVGELHVSRGFDMVVGESKLFVVPRVVGVLETGSQVDDSSFRTRLAQAALDEHIVS